MKEGFHISDLLTADCFFKNIDEIYSLARQMQSAGNSRLLIPRHPLYMACLETMRELYLDPHGIELVGLE